MKKRKIINIQEKRDHYDKIADFIGSAVGDQGLEYEKKSPKKIILKTDPNTTLELNIKTETLEQYIKRMKSYRR